ncbi:hypothetical protein HU200_037973 [Digitaria exilis]|uniref:Uncharacterized protein n=1 Tax=Digitaria exilis TaxID=1010633 RepID=A0A835BEJ4_9POAL|nr:hypothetical protein HU200_037973 [Digitaria exilis]
MGSCVSFSRSPPATSTATTADESSQRPVSAAKVVNLDGSMAQFAGPVVTASEALRALGDGGGRSSSPRRFLCSSASSPARFLCCSDELDFDAPVRAVGPRDALRPGQLYFALPLSMLGRPLSAQDMAALAVKACAALGTSPVVVVAGVPSPDSNRAQQRRRETTGRVAPVVVVTAHADDGVWKRSDRAAESADRTVGKARQGAVGVGREGVTRRVAAVRRLSAIVEADSE